MASDDLDLELATMHSMASALAALDAPARSRVLVWLRLRFDADAIRAEPAEAAADAATTVAPLRIVSMPTPIADYDDSLSVDSLGELFERRDARLPAEAAANVTGLLSNLVAEFHDLARDWDDGCNSPAEAVPAPRLLSAAS